VRTRERFCLPSDFFAVAVIEVPKKSARQTDRPLNFTLQGATTLEQTIPALPLLEKCSSAVLSRHVSTRTAIHRNPLSAAVILTALRRTRSE
jgi:hypothetical protein